MTGYTYSQSPVGADITQFRERERHEDFVQQQTHSVAQEDKDSVVEQEKGSVVKTDRDDVTRRWRTTCSSNSLLAKLMWSLSSWVIGTWTHRSVLM